MINFEEVPKAFFFLFQIRYIFEKFPITNYGEGPVALLFWINEIFENW